MPITYQIENNTVRCPDPDYAQKMIEAIDGVRVKGDSVGGIVACIARNVPKGLGCPVFDKLEADLAKAMLSLPATKGFEIGSGFSEELRFNDKDSSVQGGISIGETIYLRIAFKPTSTIVREKKLIAENEEVDRSLLWRKAREDKSGNITNIEIAKVVEKIDDLLEKKVKGEFKSSGMNDVLTTTLGNREHYGRVRGVGGCVKPQLYFKTDRYL
ncbi:chorismate synthase, chloroplastic-like [Zingiber officinale]|uniref:chorismate synthase, chloroplastic-like n=1 Tax=Zingiber officinale TaxID=94328 RepID=UPI001C4B163C|nr:chorismate synthase, chloroplastic-like [Zingiber officinale]